MNLNERGVIYARVKGSKAPTVPPVNFDPNATYSPDALVKVGPYFEMKNASKSLFLFYNYAALLLANQPVTSGTFNTNTTDNLSFVVAAGAFTLRVAKTTPSKNTGAAIAAAVAAAFAASIYSATPLFAVTDSAWAASPPISVGSSPIAMVNTAIVYRCKARVVGATNVSVFPAQDATYWEPLLGTVPEAADGARTWCTAENAYEKNTCGRCGQPL